MKRKEGIFAILVIMAIMLSTLQSVVVMSNAGQQEMQGFVGAGVDVLEMLPDPDFNIAPEVVIVGDSGEFSSMHIESEGEGDNYMSITWTHTANTALDYVGTDPLGIMPAYNDFIYLYQEFDWPYNQMPLDADFNFNYSTVRTGDFAEGAQPSNNLMFRVYVWAIDSSENWVKIYESREATYTEIFQQKQISLNYFAVQDIFAGMVETGGVQEDPEDSVRIAIGLAPTISFENFVATQPWTFYDGSVTIRITYADIFPIIEYETDPSTIMQPEYNMTYGTKVGDVFPSHQNATDSVSETCYGMVVGDDGSIYVTGNSRSSYNLYIDEGIRIRNQFLLKYNPTLELQWSVKNDNNTEVRSISFQNGYIYTTGYREIDNDRNLIVTKWSTAGEKVWETEWGDRFSQVGVGVAAQVNGTVYVIASDYDMFNTPGYMNSSILKFDPNGDLVWERYDPYLLLFYDIRGDLYIQGEYLYFSYGGSCAILNLEGEYVSGFYARTMTLDGTDGFFFAYTDDFQGIEDSLQVKIYHANATAYPIWNISYFQQWPNNQYYFFMPISMAVTPDGTLYLLMSSYRLDIKLVLLSFDLDGNLLGNQTVFTDSQMLSIAGNMFMTMGTGGLGYIAFDFWETDYPASDVRVLAYHLYEGGIGFSLTIPMVVAIGSSIVIIAAIVGVLKRKRSI